MNKTIYFELARVYWECQAHFGLSNGATSLYFYLLHRFNQARWPKTLAVSSLEIGGILGISKPSLLKFKDELAGCGILTADFQPGRIKQTYCLKSVATNFNELSINHVAAYFAYAFDTNPWVADASFGTFDGCRVLALKHIGTLGADICSEP